MNAQVKGYLVTAGIVVATLVVLRFLANSSIPGANSIAKLAVGGATTVPAS
jgi:hypothetical protein